MQKIETLGCIQSVDLRDRLEYEDKDFTPWLAQEDNPKLKGTLSFFEIFQKELKKTK